MNLKRYSVRKLNRLSRKMKIWCVGCGKRFNEMIEMYETEDFVDRIEKILDSNPGLWGIEKQVGNRLLKISGLEEIKKHRSEPLLIMITSDHYLEIYEQICAAVDRENLHCTLYPACYHTGYDFLMKAFSKFPLREQLLFYAGSQPHENADEIVKYIKKMPGKRLRVVYIEEKPTDHAIISIRKSALQQKGMIKEAVRYCFFYATSNYLFYENEPLSKVRQDQILIYLNHGTIPLKRVDDVLRQPESLDYAVCPSEGCSVFYTEQYGIPKEKQIYMMLPRVNGLFRDCARNLADAKEQVILWLPTFRSLNGTDRKDSKKADPLEIINSRQKWVLLDRRLEKNSQILVIKNHPREKNRICLPKGLNRIRVMTDEEMKQENVSLQNVLAQAKALLTDYSGIAFEYMLLDRPIGYAVSDIRDYTRGFAVKDPILYMPGEKLMTFDQLIGFLDHVQQNADPHKEQRNRIKKCLFQDLGYQDGAETLVNMIRDGRLKKDGK